MRVLAFFLQFFLVFFGYVVAVLGVGVFAGLAFDGMGDPDTILVAAPGVHMMATPAPVDIAAVVAVGAGTVGFFPGMAAILFAELAGIRSIFYYVAVAIVIAVVLAPAPLEPAEDPILFLIGCGTVGGALYWLVAGRRAGRWRSVGTARGPEPISSPPS